MNPQITLRRNSYISAAIALQTEQKRSSKKKSTSRKLLPNVQTSKQA
jgi:ribosomal protein L28